VLFQVIFRPQQKLEANLGKYIGMQPEIWRELNLADSPQPERTKILAEFNLADSRVRSSHAQNLPARARLRQRSGGSGCYTSTTFHRSNKLRIKGCFFRIFEVQSSARDYPALKEKSK
jgi:hypothetical protein